MTLNAKTLAGLTGTYQLRVGPGIPARIGQDGDRLMLRAPQIPEQELVPKSDTSFVMSSLGWQVTFTRDAASRATAITVNPGIGGSIEGKRTK